MRIVSSIAIITGGMACWYSFAAAPVAGPTAEPASRESRDAAADEDAAWMMDVTPLGVVPEDVDHEAFKYVGTASCAASNCHGGDRTGGNRPPFSNDGHRGRDATWGGEYSIWLHQDPHARAYDVLYDDLSVEMAEKLGLPEGAHRSNRCLNCHAVNVHPEGDGTVADLRTAHGDGVGCEACHGPAGDWLDLHKQADWARLSTEEKAAHGFWNTDDVLTRARVCASCHVGGPGRDVDHDLIAAGHPRLNFELSAYQAMQPKHWNDGANLLATAAPGVDEGEAKAAFEAKLWAVGQVVAAEASVAQTARRAENVNGHRVWPEFTEYGCYACHHDLRLDPEIGGAEDAAFRSWRQARGFPDRRAGRLPWNTWYVPALGWVVDEPAELLNQVRGVRKILERPRVVEALSAVTVGTLRDDIGKLAIELNDARYDGSADSPYGREWRDAHRKMVAKEARFASRETWDAATQAWLALAALERANALDGAGDPALRAALLELRATLEFPNTPDHVSSPRDFGRVLTELQSQFEKVEEIVGVEGE